MTSENQIQQLLFLKSDSSFVNYLKSVNLSMIEFEELLSSIINIHTPVSLPSLRPIEFESHILEDEIVNDIRSVGNISTDYVCFSKEIENENARKKTCPDTDIHFRILSYQQSKESQVVFDLIKVKRSKISFRKECIGKKIKSMFQKFLINKLNLLLSSTNNYIIFNPLPKILSVSLNHSKNKIWSEMSIRELILLEDLQFTGLDNNNRRHNLRVLKQIHSEEVNAFLDTKWRIHYENFLRSSEMAKEVKHMKKVNKSYAQKFMKQSLVLFNTLDY